MKTLEELNRRLSGVRDMQSVVATMKMLAAGSIRQYESAADATNQYNRIIQLALQILLQNENRISGHKNTAERSLAQRLSSGGSNLGRKGIVLFGTDQGLCGRFNEEVVAEVSRFLESKHLTQRPLGLLIGGRLVSLMESVEVERTGIYHVPANVPDITRLLQDIVPEILTWQRDHDLQQVDLFYNRRTSTASYQPVHRRLLPLAPELLQQLQQRKWESRGLPVFRLPTNELLSGVVQQYLFVQLFRACAESRASENASRIASMQRAEKNIEEKLAQLQTSFNQQRQNSITEELMDIMSGFRVAISDTR